MYSPVAPPSPPPPLPRRDRGLASEQTEVKAALSQALGSSQPTGRPRYEVHSGTRFEMLTGRTRPEGQPQADASLYDGKLLSDQPIAVRRRSRSLSRSPRPRPLGQVFTNLPDFGISNGTRIEEQVPIVLRPGFSTTPTEIEATSNARLRRLPPLSNVDCTVQSHLAASVSTSAIDQTPRERYGPVLRISPNANRFLVDSPNDNDQVHSLPSLSSAPFVRPPYSPQLPSPLCQSSSLPSTPIGSQADCPQIRRKPAPPPPRSSSLQGIAIPPEPVELRTLPPNSGSLFEKYMPAERPVIQTRIVKAPTRRVGLKKSISNLFARAGRPESRGPSLQTTSQGLKPQSSIPELVKARTSKPARLTKARPVDISAPVPVIPSGPTPSRLAALQTAQSKMVVVAETVPRPAVPTPAANQPPANARLSPTTIAQPQGGHGNSTSLSWAEITQCVNRLGKRLVQESDAEKRKKLYADFVRLVTLRADVMSQEAILAEQASLLAVMGAETRRRRGLASMRVLALYQEDGTLLDEEVPTDRIVKEW
ncbi:hypothetical protein PEBR_16439 [Penicillium brasilianum]|uniref:Uncharacterized protein n=1 Tax=Penicillium brasilianum TaxID=104259 RepID=A0A1S9RQG8_PENBI|nr:hypothetical protein PEBR_16439 [Penicillium brasilianum]